MIINDLHKQLFIEHQPSYDEMRGLLHKIYIARNITLDESVIQDALKTIDAWFADRGEGN